MKHSRSNVSLKSRVDAAVTARSIIAHLLDANDVPARTYPSAPWAIISQLHEAHIDRQAIRRSLDELLDFEFRWSGFVRLDVARIEQLLDLTSDPRSAEAAAAEAGGRERWSVYLERFRKPVATEIPAMPAECAP